MKLRQTAWKKNPLCLSWVCFLLFAFCCSFLRLCGRLLPINTDCTHHSTLLFNPMRLHWMQRQKCISRTEKRIVVFQKKSISILCKHLIKDFWKRKVAVENKFELGPVMELVAIYFAVTIIQIIQIEANHLELFNCPFEYSIAIQIRARLLQKTRHHNKYSRKKQCLA